MVNSIKHIISVNNDLGEGPLWDFRKQTLYWVDIEKTRFYCYQFKNEKLDIHDLEKPVTSLGLTASESLVVSTIDGFAFYSPALKKLEMICEVEAENLDTRFNDGAVDPAGRFWAGTMTYSRSEGAALYCLDTDMTVTKKEENLIVSNGIGWSPDRKTMYFTDTRKRTIFAYDYSLEKGEISNRRVFVETIGDPSEGVPDGLTVDSEGFVWSAKFRGAKITRYDPEGNIDREIHLPVDNPTSCIFGGKDLNELYVTSNSSAVLKHKAHSLAGDIFCIKVEVKGLEEPFFGGRNIR